MNNIKSEDDERINTVIEEAEVNYRTGRFENSATNFEYLTQKMLEKSLYEDMIYFAYRSIIARKQINDINSTVKIMQKLGINILKISTLIAMDQLNNTLVYEEKTELLWVAQKNLKLLGDPGKREKLIKILTDIYFNLSKDIEFNYEERKSYLDRNINLLQEIKDFDGYRRNKKELAHLMEEKAITTLNSQGFDIELVAARFFVQAANEYHDISDSNKYDELISNAKELDPKLKIITPKKKKNKAVPMIN
ncbi:MAG: hypothetical protein HeimC2_22790 [Candidatus Heimdallarchaeota archaeon LC_2]|nr:MAG: hypothetical protein HeimC2_22790 [Candidatus Heimdallarchaeota archaeon LC_2]